MSTGNTFRRLASFSPALLALPLLLTACDESGSGDAASIEAIGAVAAQLYYDANGNGGIDQGDQTLSDWTVTLEQPAGGVIASETTDEEGVAIFEEVPIGRMKAGVPADELGDTLSLLPASVEPFLLPAFQTAELTPVVTLPSFTVEEVRGLPTGKPLFTEGVALNRLVEGDMMLHIRSGGMYLRVLTVEESTTFTVGDSVRVSGRTAVAEGVPVLDGKAVFRIAPRAGIPQPITLTSGEAAGARGGSLDAALVEVSSVDVLQVVDEGDQGVYIRVDDGTGSLRIRFRSYFNLDADSVNPETDSFAFAVGLLVPVRLNDGVVWELHPRTSDDVGLVRTVTE